MTIEEIIEKYHKLVYKICLDMLSSTIEAEDATQDTYLNFYKNKDKYINLRENEIKNIICKIALNRCKDILKSSSYKVNKTNSEEEIHHLENYRNIDEIDDTILKEENKKILYKLINDLNHPYNLILKYHYLDEMKLDEISKILSISKPTLKVQIYRGKRLLKEKLIKDRGGGYFEEYTRQNK